LFFSSFSTTAVQEAVTAAVAAVIAIADVAVTNI